MNTLAEKTSPHKIINYRLEFKYSTHSNMKNKHNPNEILHSVALSVLSKYFIQYLSAPLSTSSVPSGTSFVPRSSLAALGTAHALARCTLTLPQSLE